VSKIDDKTSFYFVYNAKVGIKNGAIK